jgi:hypothetical protein
VKRLVQNDGIVFIGIVETGHALGLNARHLTLKGADPFAEGFTVALAQFDGRYVERDA